MIFAYALVSRRIPQSGNEMKTIDEIDMKHPIPHVIAFARSPKTWFVVEIKEGPRR